MVRTRQEERYTGGFRGLLPKQTQKDSRVWEHGVRGGRATGYYYGFVSAYLDAERAVLHPWPPLLLLLLSGLKGISRREDGFSSVGIDRGKAAADTNKHCVALLLSNLSYLPLFLFSPRRRDCAISYLDNG